MPDNEKKQVNLELKLEPVVPSADQQSIIITDTPPIDQQAQPPDKPKKAKKPKAAINKKAAPKKQSQSPPDAPPAPPQEQQWITYNSETIVNTHFIPLLGEARKFYPKLEFCDTQVLLTSVIDGAPVRFVHNSVTTTKRMDFEFLPVLMEWRQAYLCALLGVSPEQLEYQSRIDDDLLMVHKMIKMYHASNPEATDPIVIKKYAEKLVQETFSYCQECTISTEVFVRLQRLHIKIDVFLTTHSKVNNKLQKLVDVILD